MYITVLNKKSWNKKQTKHLVSVIEEMHFSLWKKLIHWIAAHTFPTIAQFSTKSKKQHLSIISHCLTIFIYFFLLIFPPTKIDSFLYDSSKNICTSTKNSFLFFYHLLCVHMNISNTFSMLTNWLFRYFSRHK